MRLSIQETLRQGRKPYLWTLVSDGLEMGCGQSGIYSRHAHRHLVDFVYSPLGLRLGTATGQAVLAQPRTPFGPIQCQDFFFMKFLIAAPPYVVPDKVEAPQCNHYTAAVGSLVLFSQPFELAGSYYDTVAQGVGILRMEATEDSLTVRSSWGQHLEVVP